MGKGNVYCETTGCAANQARGSVIKGILKNNGWELVKEATRADVVVLNTCVIKKPTEDKMLYRIKELNEKGKKLVVAGCLPYVLQERIRSIAPNASLITPHSLDNIDKIVDEKAKGGASIKLDKKAKNYLLSPRMLKNPYIGTVTIGKGCVGNCTYCVDKAIFGRLVSFPKAKIISEIKRLVRQGVKEIRLSGQDTGPWGEDRDENLATLLREISQLTGDFQIRLGMASPNTFLKVADQVVEVIKNDKRFYRFFHLPLQSGSNAILKKMNRKYEKSDFINLASKLRENLKNLTLVTDIIVGFPGETERDFRKTKETIKEVKPESVNISRYNDRPKVPARKMEGHLPSKVKKERSRELTMLVEEISLEKNESKIGETINCLLLGKDVKEKNYLGRTRNYTMVGVNEENRVELGSWVTVQVNDATSRALYGKVK